MRGNKIGLLIIAIILLFAGIVIGPLDIFAHGYFCDEIDYKKISKDKWGEEFRLEDGSFEMQFSPAKPHFAGFELCLFNQPEGNSGNINLTIMDESGKIVDSVTANLENIKEGIWYKLRTSAQLKRGNIYTLRFSTSGCTVTPHLPVLSSECLPEEHVSGNVLIDYAYRYSTFSFSDKVLVSMFIIAAEGFISLYFLKKHKKIAKIITIGVFLTAILSWNYMYNSMDNQNNTFIKFQEDSETLVIGTICADQNGIYYLDDDEMGYGMGRYYDAKGAMFSHEKSFITDDNWEGGYSRTQPSVVVNSNIYTRRVAIAGNYIQFSNGEFLRISEIDDNGVFLVIHLEKDHILSGAEYGSLENAVFCNADQQPLDRGQIVAYKSQYGLQGKIFKRIARVLPKQQVLIFLNLICCMATAAVLVVIVILIALKYNKIMSGCFFVTFWLSPWIVNFARNLYWVEFTWFIPMAAGLFCAWKVHKRRCRILAYILIFLSVMGKCLCGYEYISAVMLGSIAFLLSDCVTAIFQKDRQQAAHLLKVIFIAGITALAGFMAAISIHAFLKGSGNIIQGIYNIIEQDVMKRTNGADLNRFSAQYWPSLNASVWEVYCTYFHFKTEIITGIAGNLFPLLCVIPLCIFGCEHVIKKTNIELLAMYGVFFLTSVSWFCLAKAHSFVHLHINYVLWYFGFVQICFYIIINKIIEKYKNLCQKRNEGR